MRAAKYFKWAFLNHWNQLAFWGGVGFAVVSGFPTVLLPLVLAGEIVYLAGLGTHPKFQKYVDAQEAAAARTKGAASSEQTAAALLAQLPRKQVERFEALRDRCRELRQIAEGLRDPHSSATPSLEAMQVAGLDRLLWIYLRMLFTQHQLDRFVRSTSEEAIRQDVRRVEQQVKDLGGAGDEQRQKLRRTLEDNLATYQARLANYQKARDNHELIRHELDRLENKIQSLSEMAVNRQEPDFISSQVDQVASSMMNTEKTMTELQFLTGLTPVEEAAPDLLRRETVKAKR
jgi:hypothetical protein